MNYKTRQNRQNEKKRKSNCDPEWTTQRHRQQREQYTERRQTKRKTQYKQVER